MIAAIVTAIEMAQKRVPDEYSDFTFFARSDTWIYHAVFDVDICALCQAAAVPFTYSGLHLRREFPYLEISSVNNIFPRVHPNCRCWLERSTPEEEPPPQIRVMPKELVDKSKNHFGTTDDFREAGWIMPDGSMLDFSGKNEEPSAAGKRYRDHTEIGWVTPEGSGPAIDYFEFHGGIRFSNTSQGDIAVSLDVNADITEAQWRKLRAAVRENSGPDSYLAFDIDDNHTVLYSDYYKNVRAWDVARLKKKYEELKAKDPKTRKWGR